MIANGSVGGPRVAVLVPDHESSAGGIQTFSRFFIRAIEDCLPAASVEVFSKNDDSFPAFRQRVGRTVFHCAGWWPAPYRSLLYASQITSWAIRYRPDVILSTHVNFGPLLRALKIIRGIPYALVAHGIDVWDLKSRMTLRALRSADRVLAVSHFTRDKLIHDSGLQPDQVGIIPNTFEPDRFIPGPKPRYLLRRYGLTADQPVILTVTRLAGEERYKGYDQILKALPAILKVVPNLRYVLAGKGQDRSRVMQLIFELGVEKSVSLAGFIPEHELNDHYNLCDAFAMPSKGEGFGIVFLEALACGKPVLAGNRDGSVDALLDGELGVLLDPDDVSAIAEALISILMKRPPLPILNDPVEIRRRTVAAFGYDRFVACLAEHLREIDFSKSVDGA